MRKEFLGVLATVFVLSVGTTNVFAAGPAAGRNFIDTNGDGVCDYANNICKYVDADEDGVCDSCGVVHGSCVGKNEKKFVDADGDGICDNKANGRGRGWGQGSRGQGECGRNFVDTDSDGICDNNANSRGRGWGRGGHCR